MSAFSANVIRRKPVRVSFDIASIRRVKTVDGGTEVRIVEGYSFVNSWVGDGVNLTRESMVAASDDYNAWGAVREMHQPLAAGRANGTVEIINEEGQNEVVQLGVAWDAKGATCRSMVDTEAIKKLDTGVYKAYSVGVQPTMMRGIDVIQCRWIENSYVDRPADPDALITLVRAEGADMNAESDVLVVAVERAETFAEHIPMLQNWSMDAVVGDACYELMECLWEATRANDRAGDVASAVQSIDEFATYLKGVFETGGPGMARAEQLVEVARTRFSASAQTAEALSRVSTLEGNLESLTQRASTAEAELTTLRAELAAKIDRVTELEATPDPAQAVPVRVATERTVAPFLDSEAGSGADVEKLRAELADLKRTAKDLPTDKERADAVVRISRLKQQIAESGETA
jgi:hypothetical protein